MSETSENLSESAQWLLERWLEKLKGIIASMTEDQPDLAWDLQQGEELGEGSLILEQRFTSTPDPMLWLGIPESVHQDLGGRILVAAGLETSEAEENRATCIEAVEQSLAGLTGVINQRTNREVMREPAKQCPFFPGGLLVACVTISFGEKQLAPLWIGFSPLLISWLETKPEEPASQPVVETEEESARDVSGSSRTFELLLDVSLPVSVSFGKAELLVKEVLKLTTGSIVELNRSISEPVEIIVNGCTIARGEVVVVEGNYGVRINSIVSQKERLRTGGAAVAESRARVGARG